MFESGNSFEDKTSDSFINEAIKETLETLKITPLKFQAVFNDAYKAFYKKDPDKLIFPAEELK